MSTITPAADWFARKRATTSADPKAAYRRLVRMLAGDAERRARAPVTLPGRYGADPVGHERVTGPEPVERLERRAGADPVGRLENGRPKHGHAPRGYGSRAARGGAEPLPEDATGPYAREELERMDQDFIAAVERAFQNGGEHRSAASRSVRWRG